MLFDFQITKWNISIYSVKIRKYILNLQYKISFVLNTWGTYQENCKAQHSQVFDISTLKLQQSVWMKTEQVCLDLLLFCMLSDCLRRMFCSKCATNPKLLCHRCYSTSSSVWLMLCLLTVLGHAGCAEMVLNDACLYAGKAHASVITVFKDLSASEEMKTVQRMNANYYILFNHMVIVYFL